MAEDGVADGLPERVEIVGLREDGRAQGARGEPALRIVLDNEYQFIYAGVLGQEGDGASGTSSPAQVFCPVPAR
jgi:hypothetical protein